MRVILLSGGSGKRLWPLSNDIRSKQFLKLLKKNDGSLESMVQRVCRQIKEAGLDAQLLVATGQSQVDSLMRQLGDVCDIVVEPCRRDTFPAIALSCAYLKYVKNADDDEPVVVMPVDPYADKNYFSIFDDMCREVQQNGADMALMGIKPTYPSAKYGYIVPKKAVGGSVKVARFVEKPDEMTAEKLIDDGAYWNGGVFAFKLGYVMSILSKYTDRTDFETIRSEYQNFKKISFDYEVVEKAENIAMIPYNGVWKDLGTWNTVTEQMGSSILGNGMMDDTCKNTHIVNELSVPVVAMGTKNMVIAASADGILVADKHQSSYLKPIVEKIEGKPMFIEKAWGECKILDYASYEDHNLTTQHIFFNEGKQTGDIVNDNAKRVFVVISGSGIITIDGKENKVSQGDSFSIEKGIAHSVKALTDLDLIDIKIEED